MTCTQPLVSLWDMLEINARKLIFASVHLERIEVLRSEWVGSNGPDIDQPLARNLRSNVAGTYKNIAEAADALNAPVTKAAAERAAQQLRARKKDITFRELATINKEIQSRLEDELGSVLFYTLSSSAAGYYDPSEPIFGELVERRLPNSVDDVAEAGKCFAVGRYTACAFHLMRAMEAAVQVLSANLEIDNIEREWGKLLSDIAKKIEPMPKGDKRDAWSAVHANLYHVKQAWRNSTMHPKRTYTEEEARELFSAMRAFMRQLADLVPPNLDEILG